MKELLFEIKGILGLEEKITVRNVNEKLSRRYQELAKKKETLNNVLKKDAVRLSELWVNILNSNDQEVILRAVNISGTYNSLSKMSILGNKWSEDQQNSFKDLIVKLAEKGGEIYKQFNSQAIANTLNALSKWDVLNSKTWTGKVQIEKGKEVTEVQLFKDFIVKLAEKGNKIYKQFNSQNIANIFNALSKWDVLDNQEFKDGKGEFKSLIVKLIKQGNTIDSTQFNSQKIANIFNALSKWDVLDNQEFKDSKGEFKSLIVKLIKQGNTIDSTQFNSQKIANIFNALSKWDVLNSKTWTGKVQIEKGKEVTEVQLFKDFIVKLAEKGNKIYKQFNSQGIANTFDALYKFYILDGEKWTENEQKKFKLLIVQLAEKGQGIYEEFNSQEIANTFNAFLKLNILGNKWTSNEQEELKYFIVQLAERGGSIEGYNLKDIAKIYSALLKWSNDADEFKSLTDKLAEQVQAIAEKQNEEDKILDNIRFASQIINDLPELKLKNLVTSESKLLVPLMECLSTSIDKSEDSDLNEYLPKENILSGLEGFTEIVNGLKDKSSLKGKFDQSLITIFKKLFNAAL